MSADATLTRRGETDGLAGKLHRLPWLVLGLTCLLAAIGTATLYSMAGGSFHPWAERHLLRFLIALSVVIVLALTPPRIWMGIAWPVYAMALALLALVPLVGVEAMGARRWLSVAGVTFQPSELMKVALVLVLARYYQWLPAARVSRPLYVLVPLVLIAAPVVLTLRQPDLGTAVLFGAIGLALMFLAGVSVLYYLAGAAATAIAVPLAWRSLHPYQRKRIEVFLDPQSDPLGSGYHIAQSKIALGSGGLAGRGYGQGPQSQLDFLPEKHTDFIFTAIGEEWGLIGTVSVLLVFLCLIAAILAMSWRCRNQFARLSIAGAAVTFFLYVAVNVAMITGLVPVVGVPLPLISYGGTSMATLMVGLGIAASAYVHGRALVRRDDLIAVR